MSHMFFHLPATMPLSKAIRATKANSSLWVREANRCFSCQQGFAALSVSASNRNAVVNYIRNQERHHRKMSFENEFLALLKRHGVKYDSKYVLDECRPYGAYARL